MRLQRTRTEATVYLTTHELARYLLSIPSQQARGVLASERLDVSTFSAPNHIEGRALLKMETDTDTGRDVDGAWRAIQAASESQI